MAVVLAQYLSHKSYTILDQRTKPNAINNLYPLNLFQCLYPNETGKILKTDKSILAAWGVGPKLKVLIA